jgi:hypothetical protein
MSAVVVLIIRILLAISLYAFLGWALYTLWRELQLSNQLINSRRIPAINITQLDTEEGINQEFTFI